MVAGEAQHRVEAVARLVPAPQGHVGAAQVEDRLGVQGGEIDRPLQTGDGVLGLVQQQQRSPAARPGVGVVGRGGDRGFQGGQRRFGFPLVQEHQGKVRRRRRVQRGGVAQQVARLVQASPLIQGEAEQTQGFGMVGGLRQAGAVGLYRRRQIAAPVRVQGGGEKVVRRRGHGRMPYCAAVEPGSTHRKSAREG